MAWTADPRQEALFDATCPGMPEMSGLRERMDRSVENVLDSEERNYSALTPINAPAVAVPLYVYPSPGAWSPLFAAAERNSSVRFDVIINPASGPGGAVPDANYVIQVAKLRSLPNVLLFGYVHVQWGHRPIQDVLRDISTWAKWSDHATDIHIDGIFVDEGPSNLQEIGYMTEVSQHAEEAFKGDVVIWLNPGVPVDAAFYDISDMVNAYENSFESWSTGKRISTIAEPLRSRSTVMVHGYRGSPAEMSADAAALRKADFSSALITTSADYTGFSSLWSEFVGALGH